jgi:predicted aldo/keto reductase-like oxidoreductase
MLYNKLGNTELEISKLGFGTMRLPLTRDGDRYPEAGALIHAAYDKGINFFDVSTFYCNNHCETIFSQAIQSFISDLIVSGKNIVHQTRKPDWIHQLKNTLHIYGRDYLDLYFIHYLQWDTWKEYFIERGVIEQIRQAKEEGLIRYLGFSSHDTPENVKRLIDLDEFQSLILSYNILNRKYKETIRYASQKGCGVIVMNPLAGGLITESVPGIPELEEHFQQDLAFLALRYVFSNPHVHCTLSGMRSLNEIHNNAYCAEQRDLTSGEIDWINHRIDETRKGKLVYCTGCEYCMPCTQGIKIPELLKIWNQYSILQGRNIFLRDYHILDINADSCIRCNICKERCPNDIDIPSLLRELQNTMS